MLQVEFSNVFDLNASMLEEKITSGVTDIDCIFPNVRRFSNLASLITCKTIIEHVLYSHVPILRQ